MSVGSTADLSKLQAVMVIQSHVRGFQSRQQLSRLKAAAIYIQARWRGHQAVIAYRKLRQAANTLQAHARGQRARRHLAQMQASATIVQVHAGLLKSSDSGNLCPRVIGTQQSAHDVLMFVARTKQQM